MLGLCKLVYLDRIKTALYPITTRILPSGEFIVPSADSELSFLSHFSL